jgi:two-component system sensor histidine kinase ChiS
VSRGLAGTGLGLTIARQLATFLNGELTATSVLGQGSRFALTLPAATVEPSYIDYFGEQLGPEQLNNTIDMIGRSQIASDMPIAPGVPLILVVDDEPINIQVLRNVLQPLGYAVRAAESGAGALSFIDRIKPDLVVLDVMMPGMSGLEVAKSIRERYDLLEVPIIMVTARSRTRDVIAGFEHGANDYIVKPFVKDELLARVATLLEAARARSQTRENSSLKAEIDRRVAVEEALQFSQKRMARLLDTFEAMVICADRDSRIIYANQTAMRAFEPLIAIGETMLSSLTGQALADDIAHGVKQEGAFSLEEASLGRSLRSRIYAFELEAGESSGLALVIQLIKSEEDKAARSDNLIESVLGAIDSVGHSLAPQDFETAVEPAPSMSRFVDSEGNQDVYRTLTVSIMTESLQLWKIVTGKGKIDFAERSGIWRVNFDRSSLQVRTLDKYLLIETLPANPRWRDVIRSAEFALAQAERQGGQGEASDLTRQLRTRLQQLRTHIKDMRLTG